MIEQTPGLKSHPLRRSQQNIDSSDGRQPLDQIGTKSGRNSS